MPYSFSQLQTYLKCPMQYRLQKVDGLKPYVPQLNLHLTLWECVHSALEDLYKAKSDTIVMEESQLLETFENHRNDEIWKATEISWWRNPFNPYDLEAFHGRWVEYMKYYHNKFKPFDQAIAMRMESNVSFEIDEDLKFSGKIDRLDINWDTLIINDYKTNKSLPKDWSNSIEDQITLYAIWVEKDYWKQVSNLKWRVIYLHLQREHEWDITKEKIEETKSRYLEVIREIEDRKNRYAKWDEEAFPASWSWYTCDSCLLKPFCSKFKHMYMQDEKIQLWDMDEMTIKWLIDEYDNVNNQYKTAEERKKLIWGLLCDYAVENKVTKLYWDTKKLSITTKTTYSINKDTYSDLENKLKEAEKLDGVLAIDYNRLWKEFKEWELEYEDYKELVTKKDTTYVSRTSDLKEEELDMDVLWSEELI